MKEHILRETIRKEIRQSLKEVDYEQGTADAISNIENQPGIKMLKRALAKGGPDIQAAGLLKVINAVSGGSTAVKNSLRQMLAPKGALDGPEDEPVAEASKFAMGKKRTAGLQQKDLGGASDIKRASGIFSDIAKLDDKKKAKALAYLIKQAGVDKDTFNSFKQKIASYLNQLR